MKRILTISDLCGVGNCSLVANISVLSHFGHKVNPLTTGVFSVSTGFDFFKFFLNENLEQFFKDIVKAEQPDAVFCGFFCSASQLKTVKRLVESHLPKGLLLFVDPIMGDNGHLYGCFDAHFVEQQMSFVSGADCITPNLTEACFLAKKDFENLSGKSTDPNFLQIVKDEFADFLEVTGAKSAIITGIATDTFVANLVLENQSARFVTNEKLGGLHCGTGDLFASVVLAKLLEESSLFDAATAASQFVFNSLLKTDKDANPKAGVEFQRQIGINN